MTVEKTVKVPKEPTDDLPEGDTIQDFSSHLKKAPEEIFEEDSVRKLPGYFLTGGVLAITFLAIVLLHLTRRGPLIRDFRELIFAFSLSYALAGVLVIATSLFSKKTKLFYEIGKILLSSAAIMLLLVAAYEFFVLVVRS